MTLLHRWHASVVGNGDMRTAVCAHTQTAAVTWLIRRLHEAIGETGDAALRTALEEGIRALKSHEEGDFHWEVDGEVFAIERRIALGDLGHDSCISLDRWARLADDDCSARRWDRWPTVNYATVS